MKIRSLSFLGALALAAGAAIVAPAVAGDHKDHSHAAATAAAIGAPAPAWTGVDMLTGKSHNLSDFKGKIVVLEWYNPECPYVVSHYKAKTSANTYGELTKAGNDVVWVLVNSGAPGKQGAGVEKNKTIASQWGVTMPIINDESGKIGKMYDAKTTPHMYVINKEGVLVYAGAIDNDSNPKGEKRGQPGYVNYVLQAVNAVRAGETVAPAETKPYGCSVKYAS